MSCHDNEENNLRRIEDEDEGKNKRKTSWKNALREVSD